MKPHKKNVTNTLFLNYLFYILSFRSLTFNVLFNYMFFDLNAQSVVCLVKLPIGYWFGYLIICKSVHNTPHRQFALLFWLGGAPTSFTSSQSKSNYLILI